MPKGKQHTKKYWREKVEPRTTYLADRTSGGPVVAQSRGLIRLLRRRQR